MPFYSLSKKTPTFVKTETPYVKMTFHQICKAAAAVEFFNVNIIKVCQATH